MKKITAIFLILVMCVTMAACGGSNKKAFEESKIAYDNIDIAYKISEQFSQDIYEAWRLGIYDKDEILKDGVAHLATRLSLNEDELKEGLVYTIADLTGENWSEISDETKASFTDDTAATIYVLESIMNQGDFYGLCVKVVTSSYIANGKVEEAQNALKTAKTQMKKLSENYSDYEYYPNLKGYFTTTSALFDFCQNPTGSFQQLNDTLNNYMKEARDYINDLNYIFEE